MQNFVSRGILIIFGCILMHELASNGVSAAVMSIDLGSEWIKVGIVSAGKPMGIALNLHAKRKTPAVIAFRDTESVIGEDAIKIGMREPAAAYGYLLDLLGKRIDNPIVDLYKKRFPYYEIIGDPVRNTVIFKRNETQQFSVEELIAQMLIKVKEFASQGKYYFNECVLTVPGYFGQAERRALIATANLANLKVLQLINDYTAVALHYGVNARVEIEDNAKYYIFYDMGATKTTVAFVSYQLLRDKKTEEINPVVRILGIGYDRHLGGIDIQLRLRDYLAAEFNKIKKKTKSDVTKNIRALAKLFVAAGELKTILTINDLYYADAEIDGEDLKLFVTREKMEELCADIWPRLIKPLDEAIKSSGLSLDVVEEVIIFGGGTRVPKVQDYITNYIKRNLSKSVNADEAAAMGALYKAAELTSSFRLKKFIIKDAILFPIQATFEREISDGKVIRYKDVDRLLIGYMNAYPTEITINLNKHSNEFYLNITYCDLEHLTEQEVSFLGGLNLARIEVYKVKELLHKYDSDIVKTNGIEVSFHFDESALLKLQRVEYVFDKQNKSGITPKLTTFREPLKYKFILQITRPLTGIALQESYQKLFEIGEAESERHRVETAFNAIEEHVLDIQEKLNNEEFSSCVSEAEKEKILIECDNIIDWLYEDISNIYNKNYEERLSDLKNLTNAFLTRHWEHDKRPKALAALDRIINAIKTILENVKNLNVKYPEKPICTQSEIDKMAEIVEKAVEWKETEMKAQDQLKRNEVVRLTIKLIAAKIAELKHELSNLADKIELRMSSNEADELLFNSAESMNDVDYAAFNVDDVNDDDAFIKITPRSDL